MNTSDATIRLVVVDDHTLFRRGLISLLQSAKGLEVVGQAADVGEALRVVAECKPDVLLLDNHLPGVRGVDAIGSFKELLADLKVLMLTVSEDQADLIAALRAGADGYLLKTVESDQLCEMIRKVADGASVVSPDMMQALFRVVREEARPKTSPASAVLETLSAREQEILRWLAQGKSNKEIARALDIAETTVKIHVQHVLRKLGLKSRVQAAVFAANRGLT